GPGVSATPFRRACRGMSRRGPQPDQYTRGRACRPGAAPRIVRGARRLRLSLGRRPIRLTWRQIEVYTVYMTAKSRTGTKERILLAEAGHAERDGSDRFSMRLLAKGLAGTPM